MRKLLPLLGASLTALAILCAVPACAQEQFKDTPSNHWAYEAVTELQQKGVLLGYPDGYFKGKRTLTRYEFAIALKRMLDNVQKQLSPATSPAGPAGPEGPKGDVGPQGPAGVAPEEVQSLRKLADEFRDELKALGAGAKDVNARLDSLDKQVAAINKRLDHEIHWSTDMFVGVRSDLSRNTYYDYSGAVRSGSPTLFGAADVIHDLQIAADSNLPGGGKAVVDLCISNYPPYRGGTLTETAVAGAQLSPSGRSATLEAFLPFAAFVELPLGGPKSNTTVTIGRYMHQVTPLTYWCPNLDAYFDLPWYQTGNFVQDGLRLNTKLGSVGAQVWLGVFDSVVGNLPGATVGLPLFGSSGVTNNLARGVIPYGIDVFANQAAANQNVGLGLTLPVLKVGQLGLNMIFLTTDTHSDTYAPPNGAAVGSLPYGSEVVYDANFKAKPIGRFTAYGEWAKSVTQANFGTGDGQPNDDNNAYVANMGYASGPVAVKLGYNYIDPNFSAPGAWDKIGAWYNPTNVKGPYLKVTDKLTDLIDVHVGGDVLTGARDRSYLVVNDNIYRATAGLGYKLNKRVDLNVDYEGDFYRFVSTSTQAGSSPLQQFITFSAKARLSQNAFLKAAYQVLSYNQFSAMSYLNGSTSNANVFTTELVLHF